MEQLQQLPLKYALLGVLTLAILGWLVWQAGQSAGLSAAKSDCVNNLWNE